MCDTPTHWPFGDGAMGSKDVNSRGGGYTAQSYPSVDAHTRGSILQGLSPRGQVHSPVTGDPYQGWEVVRKDASHRNDHLGDSGARMEGSGLWDMSLASGFRVTSVSCRHGEKGIVQTSLFKRGLKIPHEMIINLNCFCMNVAFHLEWKELDLMWLISPAYPAVCSLEVLRRQLCLRKDRDMLLSTTVCGPLGSHGGSTGSTWSPPRKPIESCSHETQGQHLLPVYPGGLHSPGPDC